MIQKIDSIVKGICYAPKAEYINDIIAQSLERHFARRRILIGKIRTSKISVLHAQLLQSRGAFYYREFSVSIIPDFGF